MPNNDLRIHRVSCVVISDGSWTIRSTPLTSITLSNLTVNQNYVVCVKAETGAGVGVSCDPVLVQIFSVKKPQDPPMGDQPSSNKGGLFNAQNQQHLGMYIVTHVAF